MSFILRHLALKMLALTVVVLGVLLIVVRVAPLSPDALQGVGLCDNPCWIGIEPGVTDFDQVPDLVTARHPDLVLLLQQLSAAPSYAIQTPALAGSISATWHRVGYVSLNLQIPLWRLLILLDTPTCVRTLGNPQRPTLLEIIWEDEQNALISNFFLDGRSHELLSHSLTLWLSTYSLCETFDSAQHWPGFVAVQRRARLG